MAKASVADLRRARSRLNTRLETLRDLGPRPPRGWIRAIRESLGMSAAELAHRLGVSPSRVSQLELAEQTGTIKVETLQRVAQALDCTFVYGFLPNTSLEQSVRDRALVKALRQLDTVSHSMRLENQEVPAEDRDVQVDELADLLMDRRGLWSEP